MIRFGANQMHITDATYDINESHKPLAKKLVESKKVEQEAAKIPTHLVKLPEPYKKDTKWKQLKESITTYLHSKKGQGLIPLA
jgi:hypothetical protein